MDEFVVKGSGCSRGCSTSVVLLVKAMKLATVGLAGIPLKQE